jgi:TnpA family transposase
MTEYHARYGGNGVMIYLHVERKNVCIYSQLKSCSSSEVAAMIEGLLLHCTDAEIESDYVDTHGDVGRVRLHRAAELPAAADAEEHRRHPPVPAR